MVPSYACLFMAQLEEKLLAGVAPLARWYRFIDDIWIAWTGTEESLIHFVSVLNSKHPTIKFTHCISRTSVVFLDLRIYKGKRFEKS
jgi:hypothetical protein